MHAHIWKMASFQMVSQSKVDHVLLSYPSSIHKPHPQKRSSSMPQDINIYYDVWALFPIDQK